MKRYVIASINLSRGRLPTGRFLGIVEHPNRSPSAYAHVLVDEETLENEVLTGNMKGPHVAVFRNNEIIHEDYVKRLGDYLGHADGVNVFIIAEAG